MGYYLRALVAEETVIRSMAEPYREAVVVPLKQGLALLLNTDEFYDELQNTSENPTKRSFKEILLLSDAIVELASNASVSAPVAYIVAEFLGGIGSQTAVLWKQKQVVFGPGEINNFRGSPPPPPLKDWPINSVLKLLGVVADEGKDEFETVGLRAHRDMEEWVDDINANKK